MINKIRFIPAIYAIAVALLLLNMLSTAKDNTNNLRSPISEGISVLSTHQTDIKKNHLVYGFLPYWKLNDVRLVQLDKLTDIAYFALHIEKDGTIRKFDEYGYTDPGYNNWRNNKDLKTLIRAAKSTDTRVALTVISHEDDISDAFLDCSSCWKTLSNEIISELKYNNLTDVNFDFEYVEYVDEEKANKYTQFVQFMNLELDNEFGNSFVAVSAFADSIVKPRITKVSDLAQVADALFIMAYDFYQPTSENAGPVAPINGAGDIASYDINTMLADYLKNIPPNKLILGVAYYGYNWVVESNNPYATRIKGNDNIGYSQSQSYEAIMNTILETNPLIKWDSIAQTPFFSYTSPNTGSLRMVYYENADSLKEKYTLIKNNNLAGVGIWALGYDGGYQELWNLLDQEFIL